LTSERWGPIVAAREHHPIPIEWFDESSKPVPESARRLNNAGRMNRTDSLWTAKSLSLFLAIVVAGISFGTKAADLSGFWWIKDRGEVAALDHAKLPFTPDGAQAYKKNVADIASGKGLEVERTKCLPPGLPRLMLARYPFQILQTKDQVTFLHEKMHLVRLIHLNAEHPADVDPAYGGDSTGRWDGDTLVVDTIALKPNSVIDKTGIPHSDQLHLTERLSLKDDGKTLVDRVTMEDPKTFTRPVSFAIAFAKHPEIQLMEDVCTFGPPPRDSVKN
jgi:hypothetical protein